MGNLSQNINIANLDRRITFRSVSESQTTSGFPAETWSDLVTVWASVDNKGEVGSSGMREKFSSDRETTYNRKTFIVRYRTDIDEKMRIVYQNDTYDIHGITEIPGTRLRFLTIEAERVE